MKELINWLEDNGFEFFIGIQNSLTYKGKDCYFTINSDKWGISLKISLDKMEVETPPTDPYKEHLLASYAETLYQEFGVKFK